MDLLRYNRLFFKDNRSFQRLGFCSSQSKNGHLRRDTDKIEKTLSRWKQSSSPWMYRYRELKRVLMPTGSEEGDLNPHQKNDDLQKVVFN